MRLIFTLLVAAALFAPLAIGTSTASAAGTTSGTTTKHKCHHHKGHHHKHHKAPKAAAKP